MLKAIFLHHNNQLYIVTATVLIKDKFTAIKFVLDCISTKRTHRDRLSLELILVVIKACAV